MKHLLFVFISMLTCSSMVAQDNLSALLPMPNEISLKAPDVCFTIDGKKTSIFINSEELSFAASKLQDIIYENMQETVNISKDGELKLLLDTSLKNKEQYAIDVSTDGIVIRGASAGAVFYGVVTLEQILMGDIYATLPGTKSKGYASTIPHVLGTGRSCWIRQETSCPWKA